MTIFEKMLNKEIPVQIVYEDEDVLVINDIAPQAPCHLLLIPKQYAASLNDITQWPDEVAGRYLKAAAKVAKQLSIDAEGYRVVFNTNDVGGQTVPYLHMHLLGKRELGWPPG